MKKGSSIQIEVVLEKYGENGDKTGWTYVFLDASIVTKLTDEKRAFKVCGRLDDYAIKQVSVIPVGNGDFILPFNGTMRKGTGKKEGDKIFLELQIDTSEVLLSSDLIDTLATDEEALERFQQLTPGHQQYFSKWAESAKTMPTKADRLSKCLYALQNGMDYGQMIRHFKKSK
jgi:hypothetical protein